MFVPAKVIDWFAAFQAAAKTNSEVASQALAHLREELSAVRAERDTLKQQLIISQTQFDWLRMRVNQLEQERAVLLQQVTGLPMAAPEIVRTPGINLDLNEAESLFNHIDDEQAKKFGLN